MKLTSAMIFLLVLATPLLAGKDYTYVVTAPGSSAATNNLTIRGTLDWVQVVPPSGTTGIVAIVSERHGTLLYKQTSSTYYIRPRYPVHNAAGAALSWTDSQTNSIPVLTELELSGRVSVIVSNDAASAKTWNVYIGTK